MKEFTEKWEDRLAIILYYKDILKVFILEDYRKSKYVRKDGKYKNNYSKNLTIGLQITRVGYDTYKESFGIYAWQLETAQKIFYELEIHGCRNALITCKGVCF